MSLGKLIRRALGPVFPALGRLYRSIFIDLGKVADNFPQLSAGARILDIGGGDGEILNQILARRSDVRITMIDLADSVGSSLRPEFRERVMLLPATDLEMYRSGSYPSPDCILLSCVLHHIPLQERSFFFSQLREFIPDRQVIVIVVDVEPGHLRSRLGILSDHYITGDRRAALVSRKEIIALMNSFFPKTVYEETALYAEDRPNYCLVFTVNAATQFSGFRRAEDPSLVGPPPLRERSSYNGIAP